MCGARGALRRVGRGLGWSLDSIECASQCSRRIAQGWRYHLPKRQTRADRKREDTPLLVDRCFSSALGPSFSMEGAAASLCLSEREGELSVFDDFGRRTWGRPFPRWELATPHMHRAVLSPPSKFSRRWPRAGRPAGLQLCL